MLSAVYSCRTCAILLYCLRMRPGMCHAIILFKNGIQQDDPTQLTMREVIPLLPATSMEQSIYYVLYSLIQMKLAFMIWPLTGLNKRHL